MLPGSVDKDALLQEQLGAAATTRSRRQPTGGEQCSFVVLLGSVDKDALPQEQLDAAATTRSRRQPTGGEKRLAVAVLRRRI